MKQLLILFCLLFSCADEPSSADLTPNPSLEVTYELEGCPLMVGDDQLDLMTWNIEQFPKSALTVELVSDIIDHYNLDIIALQEITSVSMLEMLAAELTDWQAIAVPYNGSDLMLGYLYKTSEVVLNANPNQLYEAQTEMNDFAFTAFRRPLHINVTHRSTGLTVDLINIHLKCCDGSEDRRRTATTLLKDYIDRELPNENVVVLGDYNDDIIDDDNVFQAWIDDPQHYYFSTMPTAQGLSTEWSYPSFPSQIDHILITNELFGNEINAGVLTIDRCFDNVALYDLHISDHRPAFLHLRGE